MSLLNKVFASVGIGAARVDTQLSNPALRPGETLSGQTVIYGGKVNQAVEDVYLDVSITYKNDEYRSTHSLVHYRLQSRFELIAGEQKVIPFQVQLPWQTPLSVMGYPIGLRTGLDVAGLDPKDMDHLEVRPYPAQEQVFRACQELGLSLFKADCEVSRRYGNGTPFVQEFEFKAFGGPFAHQLQELEVMFHLSPETCRVLLNVDRRAIGLGGLLDDMTGMDERLVSFELPLQGTTADLRQVVADAIQRGLSRRR